MFSIHAPLCPSQQGKEGCLLLVTGRSQGWCWISQETACVYLESAKPKGASGQGGFGLPAPLKIQSTLGPIKMGRLSWIIQVRPKYGHIYHHTREAGDLTHAQKDWEGSVIVEAECSDQPETKKRQLLFEHSLALPFFGIGMKTDLFQSCGHC